MKEKYFEFRKNENSPIICNIPHSGNLIPQEFEKDFVLNEEELEGEVKFMEDNFTDAIFSELIYISSFIKMKLSRLVVDIERFEKEEDEPMSKVGMSAFYTKTSMGNLLRNITEENKNKLQKIYKDYHDTLTSLVDDSLAKNNTAMIVDCHSFPSIPRNYESDNELNRPDICIGADEYHTPSELVEVLKNNFEEQGFSVKINSPFSGSIVPMKFYKNDKRVMSVMIEVNRKLYMNEETFFKLKNFSEVSKAMGRCIIKSLNQFLK